MTKLVPNKIKQARHFPKSVKVSTRRHFPQKIQLEIIEGSDEERDDNKEV